MGTYGEAVLKKGLTCGEICYPSAGGRVTGTVDVCFKLTESGAGEWDPGAQTGARRLLAEEKF